MKLLSRNELSEKKNAEKLLEIKEGVKLATRVDSLRSTAASEEARLAAYRAASTTFTLDQIDELLAKQRIADEDLAKARAEAQRLRQPLDAEWNKLDERIAEHDVKEEKLAEEYIAFNDKVAIFDKRETALDEREAILDVRETATEDRNSEANRLYAEATVAKEAGTKDAIQQAKDFKKRESEVGEREERAATRERDADARDKKLSERESAVRDEAKRVRDLYETYQRSGKYVKRKQG